MDEIFARRDLNKDNRISFEEAGGPLKTNFSKIDTNGDRFISREELANIPPPRGGGRPPGR